jgi:hypothetical protein
MMSYVRELIVTPKQEEHIWVKHRVTPEDAEEVCFAPPLAVRGRDGSYAFYGQT